MQGWYEVSKNSVTVPTGAPAGQPQTTTNPTNVPNDQFEVMQTSVFSGGRIWNDNVGAFIQWTFSGLGGATHSSIDNTDVRVIGRYTPEGALAPDLVYGLDLNNNPSVQDVWMGVPAWRFPWWGAGVPPSGTTGPPGPTAASILEGSLVQRTLSMGAYAWWRKTIYAEFSMIRNATGTLSFMRDDGPGPAGYLTRFAVSGYNPYWRLAYSHDWGYNSIEVGTFGTHVRQNNVDPGTGIQLGPVNAVNDVAFDAQYQYNKGEPWVFSSTASFIRERVTNASAYGTTAPANGAVNSTDSLNEFFIRGTAYYNRIYGFSIGYASITGSADPGLYAPLNPNSSVIQSPDGSPGSNYFVFELNVVPLQDLRLAVQYFLYNKVNGVSGTDQFGNKPGDNNTIFAGLWWAF
jgi:hypothetical protein